MGEVQSNSVVAPATNNNVNTVINNLAEEPARAPLNPSSQAATKTIKHPEISGLDQAGPCMYQIQDFAELENYVIYNNSSDSQYWPPNRKKGLHHLDCEHDNDDD